MRAVFAFLVLLCGISAAHAQCAPPYDWSGFYSPAALDRVAQRSAPGLRSNFEQVLLPRLTDAERRKLGGVSLDLSRREYPEHPLNFYAATGRRVVLPLSSIKSMVGHLIGAAGAVEAVALALTMHTNALPPTINQEQADPQCDLDYVPNTAREMPARIAVSTSFGFGGQNAALVMKQFRG